MTVWINIERLMGPILALGEIVMLPGGTGIFCQRRWCLVCAGYDGIRGSAGRVELSVQAWK